MMMTKHLLRILPVFVLLICAIFPLPAETNVQPEWIESLSKRYWDDAMRIPAREEGSDSIFYAVEGKTYYYNVDSICRRIATHKPEDIAEELWYFYHIVDICGPERRRTDREKIAEAADRYKSEALRRELDVYDTYICFQPPLTEDIWNKSRALAEEYERRNDLQTKLRILQRMLYFCSGFPTNLVSERIGNDKLPVVKLFDDILATLDRLKGECFLFEPGYFYRQIGLIYYTFRFYDKAIPLLWKALDQPVGHFYNRNIMIARDYLGDYYRNEGNYALSDSLYLAMLESRENVFLRNTYEAVAIGGLAANANLRGEKEKASKLYDIALERALQVKDFTLAGGYAARVGRLSLEKGEPGKALELIGKAQEYLIVGGLPLRNWEGYYTLSRDYYLKTNRANIAALYIDSIASVQAEQEEIYNLQLLNYAEQQNYEQESARKEEQLRRQQTRIRLVSGILSFTLLSLAAVFTLYRRQRKKNYALFLKIMEQDAGKPEIENPPMPPSGENAAEASRRHKLFLSLRTYLLADRNFAKTEIDTGMLVSELSTNRSYLFEAIKLFTGKTLQEYINDLRLEEARKILENTEDSIEEIALKCGYNTARTFYRLFRSRYNISPAAYRRMSRVSRESSQSSQSSQSS
jgi:AraC-like DNA-binding protein/tetratricopeptide (TPR) repeat protein